MLSNTELHERIKINVATERKITAAIIHDLAEAERRLLYEEYDCTSLFDYLKKLGYANGSAQRRIDAVRLHIEIPITHEIANGELTLSQITAVAQGSRLAKTQNKQSPSIEQKRQILNEIKNADDRETQQTIHQLLDIKPVDHDKKIFQRDGSVRLEITFTQEQWDLLQKFRELTSHIEPGATVPRLLEMSLKESVVKRDPETPRQPRKDSQAAVRRQVFREEQCCQWLNQDGSICGSRFQRQVDHRQSKWRGGGNEKENLQILCANHNRIKYRRFG